MRPPPPRLRRDARRLEFAGIVVAAAVVVAAINFTVGDGRITRVEQAFCEAVDGTLDIEQACAPTPDPPAPQGPPRPDPCEADRAGAPPNPVTRLVSDPLTAQGALVTTYHRDGTARVTITAENPSTPAGAHVDLGGGVEFNDGDTWVVESAHAADQLRESLVGYVARQTQQEQVPYPTEVMASISITSSPDRALQLALLKEQERERDESLPAAQVTAGIADPSTWVTRVNRTTGQTTATTQLAWLTDPAGSADIQSPRAGSPVGSLSITTDSRDRIVAVTLRTVRANQSIAPDGELTTGSAGQATLVSTTLTLQPDGPGYHERFQIVTDWLSGSGPDSVPRAIRHGDLLPAAAIPGDSFQTLLHDEAVVSATGYVGIQDYQAFVHALQRDWAIGSDRALAQTSGTVMATARLQEPTSADDDGRSWLSTTDCIA